MNEDRVFTAYVEQLDRSTAEFPFEVRSKFRKLLRSQLMRHGLWQSSPSLLKYDGASWKEMEVLDDLVDDCFGAVILGVGDKTGEQLAYLKQQIQLGNSIDALVTQKIRFYVHDLHLAAFPDSAGVYKNLRKALKLVVSAPNPKLSLLAEEEGLYGEIGRPTSTPVTLSVLDQHVRTCSRWAAALPRVQRFSRIATELTSNAVEVMPEAGKIPFLFGELKTAVSKNAFELLPNVEQRAVAEFNDDDDQFPVFTRMVDGEDRYEKQHEELDEQVQRAIEAIDRAKRRPLIREKMKVIVRRLANNVRDGHSLSQADLAREMGIAPQTLNDYMRFIREAFKPVTNPEY